eukprot:COSAG02_NODE_13549_length_1380_cov_1.255269_2_plen_143_part_00
MVLRWQLRFSHALSGNNLCGVAHVELMQTKKALLYWGIQSAMLLHQSRLVTTRAKCDTWPLLQSFCQPNATRLRLPLAGGKETNSPDAAWTPECSNTQPGLDHFETYLGRYKKILLLFLKKNLLPARPDERVERGGMAYLLF